MWEIRLALFRPDKVGRHSVTERLVIPVLRPLLPKAHRIAPYWERIDETNVYSNFGPLVSELENRIAEYVGVEPRNIVILSNATAALEGALSIQKNRGNVSWGLPAWTFTATASSTIRAQVSGQFLDVGENWRVRTNSDVPNLIDVLPFGARLDSLEYASTISSLVIDGAASFFSLENSGSQLPTNAGLVVSLHATKSLGAGEGGFFISHDSDWVDEIRSWSNFGFNPEKESVFVGTNAKMSEYSAAVGLAALDTLSSNRSLWRDQLERALRLSSDFGLRPAPALSNRLISPYWVVETDSPRTRSRLESALDKHLIGHRNWWGLGCHKMAAFKSIPRENLPMTDHLAATTLALPMHLGLSPVDWDRIENALIDFSEMTTSD